MPWLDIISSIAGPLLGSSMDSGTAQTSAGLADPFAGQRPQYQGMLSSLMANPSSVTKMPGYQFNFDQGMQALERGQAASGKLGGGTASTEDIQYGQNYAMSSFNQWESILAQLAGANTGNPGQAGGLYGQYQNQGNQAIQSGLGAIFSGLGKIGGGSGGGGSGGDMGFYNQPIIDSGALP